MTLGDLSQDEQRAFQAFHPTVKPGDKLDELLTLADDLQAVFSGSFVEIKVYIPVEDHVWREGAEITDNFKLYSVKLEKRS